jgi:RNA polymerase sigma factor (TIGR02999 family)
MSSGDGEITKLLQAASAGDREANDELFRSVFQELRVIARSHRRRWSGNDTLNTTALINEAYLRLANRTLANYQDRVHFFATASRAMRQILINYAERVSSQKRGGNPVRVTLTGLSLSEDNTLEDLLHIDMLLDRLEDSNPRHCRLFECRVFGGMTIDEAAAALDVSSATVKRDWTVVSAWLFSELKKQRRECGEETRP